MSGDGLQERFGKCYKLSAEYVINQNPEAILVHGVVLSDGVPNPHAWVECLDPRYVEQAHDCGWSDERLLEMGMSAYDPVMGQFLPIDAYERISRCEAYERYTREEILAKMEDSGTFGPWDSKSDAAYDARIAAVGCDDQQDIHSE